MKIEEVLHGRQLHGERSILFRYRISSVPRRDIVFYKNNDDKGDTGNTPPEFLFW
jgi:hypothetical protein